MNIFFQEPDVALQDSVIKYINSLRKKLNFKCVQTEDEIINNPFAFDAYSLFILNLKDPTNNNMMKFIRKNGGTAPIVIILEKDFDPWSLKTLYYLRYDDFIVKDFHPQELAWKIYKQCSIWNDEKFSLSPDVYYDCKKCIFHHHENEVHLGKKESLFLKYLFSPP